VLPLDAHTDDQGRFYDPNGLITLGEMVNVLARNYGAASTVAGTAAVAYLNELGVAVPGNLTTAMTLTQLQSMATQMATLGLTPKADLLVVRQVLAGSMTGGDGITRDFAVAMYRQPAASNDSSPPGSQTGGYSQPAISTNPDPGGTATASDSPALQWPVFVLTD
jgi:hypothetical protein